VWSSTSTLGPLTGAAADMPGPPRPSVSDEHREKDSFASLRPAPIDRLNVFDGFLLFNDPLNTVVAGADDGGGGTAAAITTAVAPDVAAAAPPAFVAVTTTCSVLPTLAVTAP